MAQIEYSSVLFSQLLEDDKKFSLVLPHFQRGFVWDAGKQKSLLLSLLAGVPVGHILILEGTTKAYSSRPLCFDLDPKIQTDSVQYLLDGQQRISTMKSMFTDLISVEEKNRFDDVENVKDLQKSLPRRLKNRWFLKIDGGGNADAGDIFGLHELKFEGAHSMRVPQDFDDYVVRDGIKPKYVSADNGTTVLSKIQGDAVSEKRLPLWMLSGDRYSLKEILEEIAKEHHKIGKEQVQKNKKIGRWADAVVEFLRVNLLDVKVGRLVVPSGSEGTAIGVSIFEQVNRGGLRLDVYDLLVARVADAKFNLTKKIKSIVEKPHSTLSGITNAKSEWNPESIRIWDEEDKVPSRVFRTLFRNCLPICVLDANLNRDISSISNDDIKEKRLLMLTKDEIKKNWEDTVHHILHVLQFLHFRCGLAKIDDIPYELLVVPLFVCFINQSKQGEYTRSFIDNLEFWWWASIFSGHYKERHGPKVIADSKRFLNNEDFYDRLGKVLAEKDYSDETALVEQKRGRQRFEGLDKALQQYVLSKGPYDLTGEDRREEITAFKIANSDVHVHDHHVVPLDEIAPNRAKQLRKETSNPVNGPLNKAWVSENTNYRIKRVSDYDVPDSKLACESNLMPVPSDKKFVNKKGDNKLGGQYPITDFLRARFKMIKTDVEKHLKKLDAKSR